MLLLFIGSLSSHAPNWFLSPLALQETETFYTTWRYTNPIVDKLQIIADELVRPKIRQLVSMDSWVFTFKE